MHFLRFDLSVYSDLETRVWGHSRSSKIIPFNQAPMTSILSFHSKHRRISHRFRDKRRFPSKISNFPHPMYFAPPLKGLPLEFGIGVEVRNN